jgi:mannose-6-phosphate isomerase
VKGNIKSQMADSKLQNQKSKIKDQKSKTKDLRPKTKSAIFDHRPWGTFTVLDEGENYKVKRIEVLPGKRLSYQKHAQRAEHWFVVQGIAKVTLNGEDVFVRVGEDVDIEIGMAHRVENEGKETLIFIEVQRGDYLGEDDIVRLQDDYGRVQ